MDKDVGPQREKMLMDLDKFAKTASDMINNRSMNITFDHVINIRDRHNVNTFIQRRQRENPEMDYSVLNSVFVDHMFARTDNPTDSSISKKYIERIHEAACILQKMSKSIEAEKSQYSIKPDLKSVQERIDNLIELINAEKFDFEDVEAWRMGAIMENMFKDHWRNRSNELAQLRIQISERIQAGDIVTEGGVDEIIHEKRHQIIHEETNAIKAINDTELEPYFKNRLIDQLRDQVENVSRDVRITLQNEFLKHKHNIAKEEGKFSDRELQRKILEGINNMEKVENLSQNEMDRRFIYFWNSEDVINSPELKTLQKNIQSTSFEQQVNYRRYVKDGVQFALESLNYEISVRTLFPDMDSIYQWNFTVADLQSIKVMDDPDYFEDRTYRQYGSKHQYNTRSNSNFQYMHKVGKKEVYSDSPLGYYDDYGKWKSSKGKPQWQVQGKVNYKNQHHQASTQNTVVTAHTGSLLDNVKQVATGFKNLFSSNPGNQSEATTTGKYATFMIELYSKFDKSIDDNPQTQRNFDGTVDEPVIRDLCMGFKGSIEELAAKYKIKNFLKPHFRVICVVFASFKMLLPRLTQNSDQSSKKSDPVKQLDMKKDYYKKLFILKLRGAQKSEIWRQQIVHRLKEAIAQIYLQIDGSPATHHEVYETIKTFANNDKSNRFPSIETYRKFRFCMYMEIMNDAQSGQDKAAVFRKWQRICNYDMEPCEKDFIRSGFNFDVIAKSIIITCWSTYETREINFETCEKKFPASTFCRTKWRVQRSTCKFH